MVNSKLKIMKHLISILLFFVATVTVAQETPTIPAKTDKLINDFANVLTSADVDDLAHIAKSIETQSSAQVVVLITNDVDKSYPIEQFANEIASVWGVGQRGVDNGVLILICPNNHKSRIEVGRGLEGILTDAYTSRIQRDHFNPNFKRGDFYTGIKEVLQIIKTEISPEAAEQRRQLAAQQEKESRETGEALMNFLIWFVIIGLIGGVVVYMIVKSINEQRKIKEEKERKENEIRRENERIKNAAETEERNLRNKFSAVKNALLTMPSDFYNAKELINQITVLHDTAIAKLPDAIFQDYKSICRPAYDQIHNLTNVIVSNFEIKKRVDKSYETFKIDRFQIIHRVKEAVQKANTIIRAYDVTIWTTVSIKAVQDFIKESLHVEDFFTKRDSTYQNAIQQYLQGSFINAQSIVASVETEIEHIKSMCNTIFDKENEIKKAIANLNTYNTSTHILSKVNEVTQYLKRHANDISNRLRNDWNNFASQSTHFTINVHTNNPVLELSRIEKFLEKIADYKHRAEQDVKGAEQERLRRKREKEEEEERERQRVANAIALAASMSSRRDDDDRRSSSSSSNDDNSSSFGGGSFSGGGSSNEW